MHANYTFALRRVGTMAEGAALTQLGPWWLMYSGLAGAWYNVGVLREDPGDAAEAIALAEAWFEQQGATAVRFDLRSRADASLIAAARSAGYERKWSEPAMSLAPLPGQWPGMPAIDAVAVRSEADAEVYARLESEEYQDFAFQELLTRTAAGMAGSVLLVGRVEGCAVARALAVVHGGVVGVHNVYVPPSRRRRGYGAAITAAAVDAGREMGATAACLEATDLGEPVYRRMGFVERYRYVTLGKRLGSPKP